MQTPRTIFALACVAACAVGSIGIASAASAPRTVNACVDKHGTLSLLVKGTCAKGTSKLTLGTQGPTGKTGPAGTSGTNGVNGINGINGINGTRGPGDVYVDTANTTATNLVDLGTAAVASIAAVPAGSYAVTGSSAFRNFTVTDMVSCRIAIEPQGATSFTQPSQYNSTVLDKDPSESYYYGSDSVSAAISLSVPSTVAMLCDSQASHTQAVPASLLATQVGTLHLNGDPVLSD